MRPHALDGAREAEAISRDFFGQGYPGARPLDLWLMGSWLAERGDPDMARDLGLRLDSLGSRPGEREASLLGPALAAHASGETLVSQHPARRRYAGP